MIISFLADHFTPLDIQGEKRMKTRRQQQREHLLRKPLAKAINAFSKGFFAQNWEWLSV